MEAIGWVLTSGKMHRISQLNDQSIAAIKTIWDPKYRFGVYLACTTKSILLSSADLSPVNRV